jgi:hypothetical protein
MGLKRCIVEPRGMTTMNKGIQMPVSVKRIARSIAIVGLVVGSAVFTSLPVAAEEQAEIVLQDIRPDLQEVLHALTYRIQGLDFDVSETLMFDESVGPIADQTGLSYKFLNLQSTSLMKFEERADDSFSLIAMLRFEDAMGKRAFLSVAAQYTARNGAIYVEEAVVEPFLAAPGDAIVLMALSENVPDMDTLQGMSLEEVYLAILENVLSESDIEAVRTSPDQRLTLLVMDQVRTYSDTAIDVVPQSDVKPEIHAVAKINQDGWAYLLLDADFEISPAHSYNIFRIEAEQRGGEAKPLGQFTVGASDQN